MAQIHIPCIYISCKKEILKEGVAGHLMKVDVFWPVRWIGCEWGQELGKGTAPQKTLPGIQGRLGTQSRWGKTRPWRMHRKFRLTRSESWKEEKWKMTRNWQPGMECQWQEQASMGVHGLESLCDFSKRWAWERKEWTWNFLSWERGVTFREGDVLSFVKGLWGKKRIFQASVYFRQKYHRLGG